MSDISATHYHAQLGLLEMNTNNKERIMFSMRIILQFTVGGKTKMRAGNYHKRGQNSI